jgi:hypothetical protein
MYTQCMLQVKDDKYTDEGLRNRDRNIIELYGQQQEFKDKIDMDDLDAI